MDSDEENDEAHMAGEFFVQSMTTEPFRRKTFVEHLERILPRQTIVYAQYCLLRIPFLLFYDYLFTEHFSLIIDRFILNNIVSFSNHNQHDQQMKVYISILNKLFQWTLQLSLLLPIPFLGLIILILLLLCSDRRLVIFYSYTLSLIVIYFYYQMSRISDTQSSSSFTMYILQVILSSIYVQMLNIRPRVRSYYLQMRLCHLAPFLIIFTNYLLSTTYSNYLLHSYYLLWIGVHLAELFIYHRKSIVILIRDRFFREFLALHVNFGFQTLFGYLQSRIHIVTLMKVFWLTKIIVTPLALRALHSNPFITNNSLDNAQKFILNTTNSSTIEANMTAILEQFLRTEEDKRLMYNATLSKTIYFTTLFYGTETMFTLISLACFISYGMKMISHRLFRLLDLWTEDVEQIGTVVGIMFFLLLFQSNITRLDLNRRHVPLLKAFSLLLVALFHFLHTILEPQLLKIAMQTMTTRMAFNQTFYDEQQSEDETQSSPPPPPSIFSSNFLRSFHHRHLYTCMALLILLCLYIVLLWYVSTFSTWLLAITAFSLELIIRLISSLAQYTVYVLDAHGRLASVDSFDEYIFRIKAVTSCLEFILGVFLLFNGLYILCFESRGALRAFMLGVHAHMNIIKNVRRGWQILRNRKSAWDNVNQLPLATDDQLKAYNDICAICHGSLNSGVTCITPCAHIFHQKCLQKAFYATQNCALCSRPIIAEKNVHRE